MDEQIKLGSKVRDIITGFTGITTARVEFLNGCIQYCVRPLATENKMPEYEYIDHQQLEVMDGGIEITPHYTGGPSTCTPKGTYSI